MKSDLGKQQLKDKSPHVVAAAVANLALSMFAVFHSQMNYYLKEFNPKVSAKGNVLRIAQKIQEIMKEKQIPASEAWAHLTDILRLQVFCDTPEDVDRLFEGYILPHDRENDLF